MKHPRLIGAALGLLLVIVHRVLFPRFPGLGEVAGELSRYSLHILFGLCVLLTLYFVPRYRRSRRLHDEGLRLLSQGRFVAALEKFEAARPLARSKVIPTFNIALCRLHLWQLEAAERELSSLEQREGLTPPFRRLVASGLVLVAALEGRLRQASQWLDTANAPPGDNLALAVLASAVLACRAGQWNEARALLTRSEGLQLAGPLAQLKEALLAWCIEQLTGEQRQVDVIALFGEASPDTLQSSWPELVSFVLSRQARVTSLGRG